MSDRRLSWYLRRIRERHPDLAVTAARLDAGGQNNDALIVNEAVIFRFPRYAEEIARLRTEAAILRTIGPRLPLPIPDPVYAAFDSPSVGEAFTGYRMLPGEPLRREAFHALDTATQADIAADLAAFLRALHAIPEASLPADTPVADDAATWRGMFARIQFALFPHMRPDARAWATRHFAAFIDDPANAAWTPTLRHGDFGPTNILHDPATGRVTGIIDFGSVALGDPATDIAALSGYGPQLREAIYDTYPAMRAADARATFYAGTFALQDALFGIEHDDPDAFAAGIAPYR